MTLLERTLLAAIVLPEKYASKEEAISNFPPVEVGITGDGLLGGVSQKERKTYCQAEMLDGSWRIVVRSK